MLTSFVLTYYLCLLQCFIIASSHILDCCGIEEAEDHVLCIYQNNKSKWPPPHSASQSPSSKIALVTFVDDLILYSYALYSLSLISAYSAHHHIPYYIHTEASGSDYEPYDRRWNRVKILHEMMIHSHKQYEYYVWIDADIIILDLSFTFDAIISEYDESDIVISSEYHAETGIANTGCFIVRNTAWSQSFLHRWWSGYDHKSAHDQIYFDRLYKSLLPDVAAHVSIIPTHALNSVPPAMLHQQVEHKFLHLMGERNDLRSKVFKNGWNEVCANASGSIDSSDDTMSEKTLYNGLQSQLGLNRNQLMNVTFALYVDRLVDIEHQLQEWSVNNSIETRDAGVDESVFQLIGEGREAILQLKKLLPYSDTILELHRFLDHVTGLMYTIMRSRMYDEMCAHDTKTIQLSNYCALLGNDLIQSNTIHSHIDTLSLYEDISTCLLCLDKVVDATSRVQVKEMISMNLNNIGRYHEVAVGDAGVASSRYRDAYAAATYFVGTEGYNMFHALAPLRSLSKLHCMHVSSRIEGICSYYDLLTLYDAVLAVIDTNFKEDYVGYIHDLEGMSTCIYTLFDTNTYSDSYRCNSSGVSVDAVLLLYQVKATDAIRKFPMHTTSLHQHHQRVHDYVRDTGSNRSRATKYRRRRKQQQ